MPLPDRLLLMRHARPMGSAGPDFDRPLAPEGWTQARSIGRQLAGAGIVPTSIFSSAALRCVQTAGGVIEGLGGPPSRVDVRAPFGQDDGAHCIPLLEGRPSPVLIVSHQPTLLSLTAALPCRDGGIDLRQAHVVVLVRDAANTWTVETRLTPA
jgi:phosphohistidine phosphatase SixA